MLASFWMNKLGPFPLGERGGRRNFNVIGLKKVASQSSESQAFRWTEEDGQDKLGGELTDGPGGRPRRSPEEAPHCRPILMKISLA